VDWKDTGEEAAPTSGPSQDKISLASDAFEFESSSESTFFKVGSLKTHVEFWSNSVQASDSIISTIVDGHRIPFIDLPASYAIPNRPSAFKFKHFVNEAISELIERGCVMEVDIPPVFMNPLHVVQQSSGKCRCGGDFPNKNKTNGNEGDLEQQIFKLVSRALHHNTRWRISPKAHGFFSCLRGTKTYFGKLR